MGELVRHHAAQLAVGQDLQDAGGGRHRGVLVESWREAPPLAFVFSMLGFFIGPIYPTIVSLVLSRLEKARHPSMTGLIIVFSALGGTTGSFIVGFISRSFSTHDAFFYPLLPMTLLGVLLIPYRRLTAPEVAA